MRVVYSRRAGQGALAILAWALLLPAQSWAESTEVLPPTGTAAPRDIGKVSKVIKSVVETVDGVALSSVAAGPECAIQPNCLASAGRDDGVTKVIGMHLSNSGSDFVILFLAVDAATSSEIARHEIPRVKRKSLGEVAGQGLLDFLSIAGGAAEEPAAEEPAAEEPAVEEPAAEPAVAATPVASKEREVGPQPLEGGQAHGGNALALGISVGQPIRLTAKYRIPAVPLALEFGIGSGVLGGTGLHMDANLTYEHELGAVQIAVGAGYRQYLHDYDPMSIDELGSDVHQGVQALVGASYSLGELDLFGELMPGLDLAQSESCFFMSGVNTVCPHQDESRGYFNVGVGARYWIKL